MDSLRDQLIATTDMTKASETMAFFQLHLNDRELLAKLVEIALEGEDAGDAPWAAANVIAEYPSALLRAHENSLRKIAAESWVYLSRPATAALAKLSAGMQTYILTISWWGDDRRSNGGEYAFDASGDAEAMAHARCHLTEQIHLADQSVLTNVSGRLVWENEWLIDRATDRLPPG
jgi:hypothetical protein